MDKIYIIDQQDIVNRLRGMIAWYGLNNGHPNDMESLVGELQDLVEYIEE